MPLIHHFKSPTKMKTSFEWLGTGFVKNRRRPTEIHYTSCLHGDLEIKIDDFVLVRNDDAMDPESEENCFVAKVLDLYETDDKDMPYKAQVQWYSRMFELPPQYTRNLPDKDFQLEVVEDNRSEFSDIIDAESIFSTKCHVFIMSEDFVTKPPKKANFSIFYCRYKFNGSKISPVIPKPVKRLIKDSPKTIQKLASPNPLRKRTVKSQSEVIANEMTKENSTPKRTRSKKMDIPDALYNLPSVKICIPKLETVLPVCDMMPLKRNGISKSLTESEFIEKLIKTPIKLNGLSKELQNKMKLTSPKESCDQTISEETPPRKSLRTPSRNLTPSSVSVSKIKSLRRSTRKSQADKCLTVPSKKTVPVKNNNLKPKSVKQTARRLLVFGSKPETTESSDQCMSTSRYGRKIKLMSNDVETVLDALLLTPKKYGTPQKRSVPRRNTKFYHSDESGDESVYIPSDDDESSEDDKEMIPDVFETVKTNKNSTRKSTPKTPRSKKSQTPVIPGRHQPVKTPQSLLEESRQRLHVSAVPSSLPCREDEFFDIFSFIRSNLLNDTGGCMYVSGVPGTGKTATVHEVIRSLQKEKALNRLPAFKFIEVNGMKMTDPYQCYVQIYQKLTGERIAPQQAAHLLEKRFTQNGPKKEAIVLLVDELDKLWTRKQTVMYNIFDWPAKPTSRLIVVAIANTMDLPERIMMNRISSRLGLTRRTFQPYTFRELQEIVMSRIKELNVFNPDAVQLVARKVAAISGDARRALEICRRAAEVAEEGSITVSPSKKPKMLVGMAHVDAALNQMFSSPIIAAIQGFSELQKTFLKAVLAEFQRTGSEETNLLKLHLQLIPLCRFEGLRPPTTSEMSEICVYLASSSILLLDNIQNDLYMKIRLNVSIDDVNFALTGRMAT